MKSALAVIYNHRFDRNIPVVDRLYGPRFEHIHHVVPFYDGAAENVIPTFYGAYSFQGFFADYFDRVRLAPDVTHVTFIGDDLILNPALNAATLPEALGLGLSEGYIKEIIPLPHYGLDWAHVLPCIKALQNERNFKWREYLPPADEALEKFSAYGYSDREYRLRDVPLLARIRRRGLNFWNLYRTFGLYYDLLYKPNRQSAYPLLAGYSDLITVPVIAAREFSRLCRLFAAAGVFVEVAAPTALALACEHIKTEADTGWKGLELWREKAVSELEESHQKNLGKLLQSMPDCQLYIHPVKLSKWITG